MRIPLTRKAFTNKMAQAAASACGGFPGERWPELPERLLRVGTADASLEKCLETGGNPIVTISLYR